MGRRGKRGRRSKGPIEGIRGENWRWGWRSKSSSLNRMHTVRGEKKRKGVGRLRDQARLF